MSHDLPRFVVMNSVKHGVKLDDVRGSETPSQEIATLYRLNTFTATVVSNLRYYSTLYASDHVELLV